MDPRTHLWQNPDQPSKIQITFRQIHHNILFSFGLHWSDITIFFPLLIVEKNIIWWKFLNSKLYNPWDAKCQDPDPQQTENPFPFPYQRLYCKLLFYLSLHHHMDGIHMMLCLCSPLLTCEFPAGPRVCARHMRFTILQAPCVIYILQHFYGLKIRLQYIQPFPTFVFVPFVNLFF